MRSSDWSSDVCSSDLARPARSAMMVSLGPFTMSLVVLLVALAIAALVARQFVVPLTGHPAIKPLSTFLDMLMVGVLAAWLAFVLAWLSQPLPTPLSFVRLGTGIFLYCAGLIGGLSF